MQDSMNKFSTACDNFGLTISIKKTEIGVSTGTWSDFYSATDIGEKPTASCYKQVCLSR